MTEPEGSGLAVDEGWQCSRDVLFEQGADPIAHVTLDDSRSIRDVNPRFESVFGCDRESVEGESLFDIVRPDPGVGQPVEAAAPGGDGTPVTTEVTRTTADGSRRFTYRLLPRTPAGPDAATPTAYAVYAERADEPPGSDRYRKSLYMITSDTELTDEEKISRLLDLGCERLGVENGHLVTIDEADNRHEIVSASGSSLVRAGSVTALSETYCRRTIASDDILCVYNAPEQGWGDDPAYEHWNIGCYLGGKIVVDDELFGTLCFVDEAPRAEPFTHAEKVFVELMVRWVSHLYERRKREAELRETNERLNAIIETSPDALVAVDSDWKVDLWNDAAERIFGWSADEVLGDRLPIVPEDQTEESERFNERLVDGEILTGVETKRRRKDGTRIDVSVSAAQLRDTDGEHAGVMGVIEDITERKEHERALTSLHEIERELLTADSKQAVADLVVDAAAEALRTPAVAIYQLDTARNELTPVSTTDAFVERSGGAPSVAVGDSDSLLWQTFATGSQTFVTENDDISVFGQTDVRGLLVPLSEHGVFVVLAETGAVDSDLRQLFETLAATTATAFDRFSSEATLRERDAELRTQNERLEREMQINRIIRSINRSLVDADTRAEIETAVCERLAESDSVRFAWIGTTAGTGTRIEPQTWAGDHDGYLDALELGDPSSEPCWRTATSGTATTVPNVVTELQDSQWATEALSRHFHSVVSVPLSFDEYTYGVLTVYAGEPDAFGDRERSVFEELGEGIAHSINALQSRQALSDETVIELELTVDSGETLLGKLAQTVGCAVTFEGAANGDDGTRLFFRTTAAPCETVQSALDSLVSVSDSRLVTASEDGCLFEATVSGPTIAAKLATHGGRLGSLRADADEVTVAVTLQQATDVRAFLDMFTEQYPSATLTTRRNVELANGHGAGRPSELLEHLTERQREVIRAAYLVGFFETPRTTSAEGIAEMFDVSQPTVSRHLRRGQQRLFAALFEQSRT